MRESKASRTLLKSPPELWSEVSTATSLQRHMDQFGEIRITKLEPESAVAWEGEHARGTITLEVSGWGTKVSLTAEPTVNGATDATKPEAASGPTPEPASYLVEPETTTGVNPAEGAEREIPDPTASAQHGRVGASAQRPRWTRRVAAAFRRWLSPPLEEEPDPIARASEPEPERPAARATHSAPELVRPVSSPRLPEPAEPKPQTEPPPQIDEASTAALDATLDSLGQAHHRPFSRA
jgi:hypothetical protein